MGRNGESKGAARRSIGQATARGNGATQLNHEDQQYLNVVIHVISAEMMMLTASEEWNKRVAIYAAEKSPRKGRTYENARNRTRKTPQMPGM